MLEHEHRFDRERLRMSTSAGTSADPGLVVLAKAKLATEFSRGAELDRLTRLLHEGERVVTLGDALWRAERHEHRGLIVLTDQRLMCVDAGSRSVPLLEVRLGAITSLELGLAQGSGDARRGELTIRTDGVTTHLGRVRPWGRAAEIAELIGAGISARTA
jgi:hypothetical protein